ncbi:MAG: NDP-sugar synthase [Bdellovibrio sp.]|nr:MAG: NDP-sugar synthase [Bdellovibrio sp.]
MLKGMILAAGLGQRLRPLTEKKAKPALPLLNLPLLAYNLFYLEQLGIQEVIINTHHCPHTVEEAVTSLPLRSLKVCFSYEDTILGTGGGIWKAKDFLKSSSHFVVCNGDNLILLPEQRTLKPLLEYHQSKNFLATHLVGQHKDLLKYYGAVWVEGERVIGYGKTPPSPRSQACHLLGVTVFSRAVFEFFPEGPSSILTDVLAPAISKGQQVGALPLPDILWLETGTPEAFKAAQKQLLNIKEDPGSIYHSTLNQILERFLS